jgi:integrase
MTQRQELNIESCSELNADLLGGGTQTSEHSRPEAGMTVRERLNQVALERELRPSTRIAYQRALTQLGILDETLGGVTQSLVTERLWQLSNPNTRRGAAIAARSVLGFKLRIGKSVPRRYTLPIEQDIRLALLTSPHETRALLMQYCALRLGEACAITRADLSGDRLRVDKQIQALRETGRPTIVRVAQVKCSEADVVIPAWLAARVQGLTETVKPDPVRESIRRAFKRVGIEGMTVHGLRHWFASTALDRGAPVMLVSRALRHSDVSTTLRCYHDTRTDSMEQYFACTQQRPAPQGAGRCLWGSLRGRPPRAAPRPRRRRARPVARRWPAAP